MIVSCPSCGTRYNHHFEESHAASALCSHCDGTVPIVEAKKPYVLMPSSSVGGPAMRIGVDDPQLAERLAATAPHGDGGSPRESMACRATVAEGATYGAGTSRAARFGSGNGAAPAIYRKRSALGRSAHTAKQHKSSTKPAEQERSRKQDVVIAAVLSTIGAAAAYYSAVEQGLNPVAWIVAGGGLGLFMAWICIKWTRRS